jgi:hypothetical protein
MGVGDRTEEGIGYWEGIEEGSEEDEEVEEE